MGPQAELGDRLNKVSSEWIRHNEVLATSAGRAAIESIEQSRWRMLVAIGAALALSAALGWLTFRRIANPIQALQTSVESIARGDFAKEVPFTKAVDETGGLARFDFMQRNPVHASDYFRLPSDALVEIGRQFSI